MGNNIGIDLFTQKSEITASTPDITIEITGLAQLNSFIGLDDTPTYYENGKFFKVVDNKIVYTDINWGDIKGQIEDNPELKAEVDKLVEQEAKHYTGEVVAEAITAHDHDVNAHQSIQLTIQDNYNTLDNKIELNKIDSDTKFEEANKKISENTDYITKVDNYSQEVNKKLEDLTLEVDVDIKGDINQLREDLTTTNQVVQDNYNELDKKIDDTKSELSTTITNLETKVDENYTNLDTRVSANTKDIADLTQTVQDDYKEINDHITDLYNKKVDKVEGKELSTNDFTDELKSKLENIEDTAQVNIIESISVDGTPQVIDDNKNVDLHQPVYTLVKKETPDNKNIYEYNLTVDNNTTGVTIEIPKDVYVSKCTLKYATAVDQPYTGAKINDAYLQFDRENSTPIYAPIPELQIHAGQDITVDENNVISTVIPIPRKISELDNDNFTVTDENYVHTDNNFTDGYITRIETLETNTTDNISRIEDLEKTVVKNVEYNKDAQKITITFGDKSTKVLTLEELLTGASYDGDTGDFTFTKANGEAFVVNTPKENFLSDVQYDGTTKIITFTMSSGSTFEVNVSDLIDVYIVKSTNSVEMSIENGNEISSNVKLSKTEGNIISVETDGLYAKHQDISHLATKDELTTNVNTLDKKIDDTKSDLTASIDTKVDKVEGKSLIADTEIERLATLKNYDDTTVKKDITDLTTTVTNNYTTLDGKIDSTKTELTTSINNLDKKVDTKQDKLKAGTGIAIDPDTNTISNTQTSAEWGNITGTLSHQKDLQNALNAKASTTSVTNLETEVTDLSGRVTANEADIILKADKTALNAKQDKLVSGINIKTINQESILGKGDITIKSAPDLDNKSITKNTNEELQTVAVINSADNTTALKTWTGTRTEYDSIETKDENTLYNVLDDNDLTRPILEAIYPVGSIYLTFNDSCPLSTFFGTWELVDKDKVLQGAGTRGAVGTELSESLPNIKGNPRLTDNDTPSYVCKSNTPTGCYELVNVEGNPLNTVVSDSTTVPVAVFNASKSSSTYQDNAPVQPDAILVNIFRRVS